MTALPPGLPPPVPDKGSRFDQRVRGWLAFMVGLGGAVSQIAARLPNPAVMTFCMFLMGTPLAERLWAGRKEPNT